jgi:hypothetical protein
MLVWQFRLMGDTVKGEKDGSMMICGKYLLSYGDGCDENLMTKKESATATTIITYHDYWESLSDCQFPVCSNVSEPLLPCLHNLYTIDNRYKHLLICLFNSTFLPGLSPGLLLQIPSQALVPGCSWHVFCATRQLLEPNHGPCDRATVPWVAFKRIPRTGSSWKFQHLRYQSQHVSAIHVLCLLCIHFHRLSGGMPKNGTSAKAPSLSSDRTFQISALRKVEWYPGAA